MAKTSISAHEKSHKVLQKHNHGVYRKIQENEVAIWIKGFWQKHFEGPDLHQVCTTKALFQTIVLIFTL